MNSITKDTTRRKNRIKSQLRYLGIEIPLEFLEPFSNWSKRFLAWLKEVETLTPSGRQAFDIQIRHLEELRRQKLEMTRALRALAKRRTGSANRCGWLWLIKGYAAENGPLRKICLPKDFYEFWNLGFQKTPLAGKLTKEHNALQVR